MRTSFQALCAFLFILLSVSGAAGQARTIRYDGRLERDGRPVQANPVAIRFEIYPLPVGGQPIWATANPVNVAVNQGLFTVELGGAEALPPLPQVVLSAGVVYVATTVDGVLLTPRRTIGAVPFAVRALNVPRTIFLAAPHAHELASVPNARVDVPGSSLTFDVAERSMVDDLVTGDFLASCGQRGQELECGAYIVLDGQSFRVASAALFPRIHPPPAERAYLVPFAGMQQFRVEAGRHTIVSQLLQGEYSGNGLAGGIGDHLHTRVTLQPE